MKIGRIKGVLSSAIMLFLGSCKFLLDKMYTERNWESSYRRHLLAVERSHADRVGLHEYTKNPGPSFFGTTSDKMSILYYSARKWAHIYMKMCSINTGHVTLEALFAGVCGHRSYTAYCAYICFFFNYHYI